jgi:hypothetical protein
MFGAWRSLKQWGDEECARIEAARPEHRVSEKPNASSRDNHEQEAFEIPPLHTLRQT